MIKKIARVITSCHDCIWCNKIVSDKDRHTKVFICQHDVVVNDEVIDSLEPFLLDFDRSSGNHELPIPDKCPLEDYKPQEK